MVRTAPRREHDSFGPPRGRVRIRGLTRIRHALALLFDTVHPTEERFHFLIVAVPSPGSVREADEHGVGTAIVLHGEYTVDLDACFRRRTLRWVGWVGVSHTPKDSGSHRLRNHSDVRLIPHQ